MRTSRVPTATGTIDLRQRKVQVVDPDIVGDRQPSPAQPPLPEQPGAERDADEHPPPAEQTGWAKVEGVSLELWAYRDQCRDPLRPETRPDHGQGVNDKDGGERHAPFRSLPENPQPERKQ